MPIKQFCCERIFIAVVIPLLSLSFLTDDFVQHQKTYARVRLAYKEKESGIIAKLKSQGLDSKSVQLIFCAFKKEKQLKVFAKDKSGNQYSKLISYPICQSSGELGPKRRQGDAQVPEGFYYIHHFNPNSNFYLSLGISYPNKSDKIRKTANDPGGAIYIHGDCVTIGCLPITDDKIKELYVLALMAYQSGQQKIPVYIFPCELTEENVKQLSKEFPNRKDLISFWKNIKNGYHLFFKYYRELEYSFTASGDYVFTDFR
jgi:murein L,D-transpeptidase YafK